MALTILCDFDGTVTQSDTADTVFSAFAAPAWHEVETLWEAGEIGSAECMRLQMELVDASCSDLDRVLDTIDIDPSFPAFSRFCKERGIDLMIVSDGVEYFIRHILGRHGLTHLPVRANRLVRLADGKFSLEHPNSVKDCASGAGTCKCAIEALKLPTAQTVLIGDGRSDFCVSQEADIVFAKKSLLRYTRDQGIDAHAFSTFRDVQDVLERIVSVPRPAFFSDCPGFPA